MWDGGAETPLLLIDGGEPPQCDGCRSAAEEAESQSSRVSYLFFSVFLGLFHFQDETFASLKLVRSDRLLLC